mgnify:FL=1
MRDNLKSSRKAMGLTQQAMADRLGIGLRHYQTMVRNLDDLGRIVIPKEMRTPLEMGPGTPMEIIGSDEGIYLRKQQELPLSERVRRLRKEAVQEGASVEVIYQMNQLLDVLEDC